MAVSSQLSAVPTCITLSFIKLLAFTTSFAALLPLCLCVKRSNFHLFNLFISDLYSMSGTAGSLLIKFLFVLYLLVLCKLIVFKSSPRTLYRHFRYHYNRQQVKSNFRQANLTPFVTIRLYLNSNDQQINPQGNLWGNYIGFIPLGFLLPVLFIQCRKFLITLAFSFLISLLFELTQLITALGSFDVDDLLLNTLGGITGYIIWWLFRKII